MSGEERGTIKTVVVEDEVKILSNICSKICQLDPTFEIVGTAVDGREALEKIDLLRPQVVFTDISMPVMGGMELIKAVRDNYPSTVIVIVSGYSDFAYAQQAIRYGVSNYLLKPLENDSLIETLFDIKKSLSYFAARSQRHIFYSDRYEMESPSSVFLLAMVCVGNVIYNPQNEEVQSFYLDAVRQIHWPQIMKELLGSEAQWFVADDHAINQKIVAVKTEGLPHEASKTFLERLWERLKQETSFCVSLCSSRQTVPNEELWNLAKRLRNLMKQHLVVGRDSLFLLEEEENRTGDMLEIVKMKMNTYIKGYFLSTDLESFLGEIRLVFKYMESNHAPQENVEKICIYVLKLLEFADQNYDVAFLGEMQERMMKSISISVTEEELYENLMNEFEQVSQYMDTVRETSLENTLLKYVDDHFLTIESIEQVAEEFNYNYAYLSRLFKKKAGQSMNKYITSKKISLAKELMRKRPDLKLTEVSDLCGYNDWRYFSRVFKTETGMAPSEFKAAIPEKSAD